jgi:4-diphosphocytidyl-2-C-methyl-D-erythritol kinase
VPKDSSNLCWRSAKLLQDAFNIEAGLDIEIIKRIPVGAGLGGGSGNAAAILLALNKLWNLNLSRKNLAELAKRVGSDVPFFIYDVPFAVGCGRGDRIKPVRALKNVRFWQVLVVPKLKVSTPAIYKEYDKDSGLTAPKYDVKMLTSALRKKDLSFDNEFLFNSLEPVTAKLYPVVGRIKEGLKNLGAKLILMSGSGPAVFGIVASRKEALSLAGKVQKKNRSWQAFVVKTC